MSSKQLVCMALACMLAAGCGNGGSEQDTQSQSSPEGSIACSTVIAGVSLDVNALDPTSNPVEGVAASYTFEGGAPQAAQCSGSKCVIGLPADGLYVVTLTKAGYSDGVLSWPYKDVGTCGVDTRYTSVVTMRPQ